MANKIEKYQIEYNYYNIIKSMKPKVLNAFLTFIIYGNIDSQFIKANFHNNSQRNFIELMKRKAKISDFKSPLWKVLSLKEKVMM